MIAQIDASLHVLNSALNHAKYTLLRRRNAITNINTLPVEILRPILIDAAGLEVDKKIAIATTCSRWWDVCLAYPPFWSHFHIPATAQRAHWIFDLARRQGHPLHLTIPGKLAVRAPAEEALRGVLRTHADLIQTLDAHDWPGSGWLEHIFPALAELRVTRPGYLMHDALLPWYAGQQERAPHLRQATFVNCRLPYLPKCYASLRALSIVYPKDTDAALAGGDRQFQEVLRACPDLEELEFVHAPHSFSLIHRASNATTPIPLLRLRYLKLDLDYYALTAFLAHIHTSRALTTVVLHANDITNRHGWLDDLAPEVLTLPSPRCLPMLSHVTKFTIRNFEHRGAIRGSDWGSREDLGDHAASRAGEESRPGVELGFAWRDPHAEEAGISPPSLALANFLASTQAMHNGLPHVRHVDVVGELPAASLANIADFLRTPLGDVQASQERGVVIHRHSTKHDGR